METDFGVNTKTWPRIGSLLCTHNRAPPKKKNDFFGQVLKHLASLLVVLRKPLFYPKKKRTRLKKRQPGIGSLLYTK